MDHDMERDLGLDEDLDLTAEQVISYKNAGHNLDQIIGGRTLLMAAVCKGDANVCQALIEHGLDVNQEAITPPFNLKMKPICQAVRLQNMVITQQLIEAGAELDGYDTLTSPLHLAISNEMPEFVDVLLKAGCQLNDNIGVVKSPALHLACVKGNLRIVQMLLENGADPNIRETAERLTPGFHTTSVAVLQVLLAFGMDINARGRSGETMLHAAVTKGDLKLVVFLLNNGANVNVTQLKYRYATTNILHSCYEQTALHIAAEENYFEICKTLVQHGCSLNFLLDPENSSDILLRILNTADIVLCKTVMFSAGNWDWTKLMTYNKLSHFNGKDKLDAVWGCLVFYSHNPFPLKAQCRLLIRKHFKVLHTNRSIYKYAFALPIPELLKRYLTMDRVD